MWTFIHHDEIEPTNNAAERATRHAVIWRMTNYGNQSQAGSRSVERTMTAVATRRLPKRDVLDYPAWAVEAQMLGDTAPSLLPAAALLA